MSYFPHAFQKTLIGTAGFFNSASASVSTLTAGQIGVVDAKTHNMYQLSTLPTAYIPQIYLAQGSFHTVDKIGPYHGGYKETIKTKGISPRFVSRFYKVDSQSAVNQIVKVGCDAAYSLSCNKTYRLRLDIKGSPALRFLSHNVYKTLDGFTGCCAVATDIVDPTVVFLAWKDQINNDPILKQFVSPKVYSKTAATTATWSNGATTMTVASATGIVIGQKVTGTGIPNNTFVTNVSGTTITFGKAATAAGSTTAVVFWTEAITGTYVQVTAQASIPNVQAHLDLTAAYQDTTFGNCSFDPKDFVEMAPVQIYPSVVDESGNPCSALAFCVTETQAPVVADGLGETVLRELILQKRYLQEPWQQDPRKREVLDDTSLTDVSRSTQYKSYYILHNVPRNSNPSGTLDSDQYLIRIVVTAFSSAFESWFTKFTEFGSNKLDVVDASTLH
ncbi:MAG: hypothetical protein ACR2IJ_10565 [Fluviibacter sp.]